MPSNFAYCCGLNFLEQWRYCWLSSGSLSSDIQNRARQVSSRGENFSAKQNLPKGIVLGHECNLRDMKTKYGARGRGTGLVAI